MTSEQWDLATTRSTQAALKQAAKRRLLPEIDDTGPVGSISPS